MKLKVKMIILAASMLLSLAVFNLIAGPSVNMLQMGKDAGNEMIARYLARAEQLPPRS
jgi:hypothetical protein